MNSNLLKHTATTTFFLSAIAISNVVLAGPNFFRPLNQVVGTDHNSVQNPVIQPQDPALSGGGRDQSLGYGDVLIGRSKDDLIIGNLGVDILAGNFGSDIMLGGLEHFTENDADGRPVGRQDRAFGGLGHDIFLWKPGDASDFFDGGQGVDAIVFGLVGETVGDGAFEFKVVNDGKAGDVYINEETHLPMSDVTNSPGFCEVIDKSTSPEAANELNKLGLDHLVRFVIRDIRDAFEAGNQKEDNGVRATLHLRNVQVLVCTSRDGDAIDVVDLMQSPPQLISNGVSVQELKKKIKPFKLRKRLEAMVL